MARTNKKTVDKKELIEVLERGISALKKIRRKRIAPGEAMDIVIESTLPRR